MILSSRLIASRLLRRTASFVLGVVTIVTALSLAFPAQAKFGQVSTWLGRLQYGEGKNALQAFLDNPNGFTADTNCSLYLADSKNNLLRKIDGTSNVVSRLAGTGHYSFKDGIALKSRFRSPADLELAPDGSLYIVDTENGRIRILRNAVVSTWLKGLRNPSGLLLLGDTMYISDTGNNRILIATPPRGTPSVFTTITSPGKMASLRGFLYVTSAGGTTLSRVDVSTGDAETVKNGLENLEGVAVYKGAVYFVAGPKGIYNELWKYEPDTGTVTQLQNVLETEWYNHASDLLFCNDRLYLLFSAGSSVFSADVDGAHPLRIAGKHRYGDQDGSTSVAMLGRPKSLVLSSDRTKLYLLENHKVKEVVIASRRLSFIAGHANDNWRDGVGDSARMSGPTQMVLSQDGSKLYIVDRNNNRIRTLVIAERRLETLTGAGAINQFGGDTNGYAEGNPCVSEINRAVAGCAYFNRPMGIAVSNDGTTLYIADSENNRIRSVTVSTGVTSLLAGSGSAGLRDGVGANARFKVPTNLLTSKDGTTLFVVDQGNHALRAIDLATKRVKTLLGSGRPGYREGSFSTARISIPDSLAYGPGTTLFLSEGGTQRIRQLYLTTRTTRLVAGSGQRGTVNALKSKASFYNPRGMVMLSSKLLLVADQLNDLIRLISLR